MNTGFNVFLLFIIADCISSVAFDQILIISLCLSSSDIRPRLKFLRIISTFFSASFKIPSLSAGTSISEIDTVTAPLVEYLNPNALMLSKTSAVLAIPCLAIHLSIITPSSFFLTGNSISLVKSFSGFVLSTKPKSCGIISLNIILPTVVSIIPVLVSPFISFETLIFILACKPISLASYAIIASSML